VTQQGCASYLDLELLGLPESECITYGRPEKKQRGDCLCLAKQQILGVKPGRCPHGCLYCFWKDSAVQPDVIVLDCLDGKLNFSRKAYEESGLVRDLIDAQKEWIAGHTVREVSDELEELYTK
jgi:hypothetical protein